MIDKPNNIDWAWRSFIRDIPEMNNDMAEAAFVAGASAALSIIYRRGFENLESELKGIQEDMEMEDADG